MLTQKTVNDTSRNGHISFRISIVISTCHQAYIEQQTIYSLTLTIQLLVQQAGQV